VPSARFDGPASSNGRGADEDDLAAIEAFRNGDLGAFEALVRKYQHRIYTLCRYLLQNPQDADDAAQDTFVKAFQGLKRFSPVASFYTWLYRIASNTCFDRRRRASVRTEVSAAAEDDFPERIPSPAPSPESAYETKQATDALHAALQCLSEKLRVPLVLKEVEGLSYEEIAAAMDIGVGTVKSRISRAREELATALKIPRNKTRGETLKKTGEEP
jgi:RNA polymerase sigma-70 factor (ECF subfamily)